MMRVLALLLFLPFAAQAETLRVAVWSADLTRSGPGLLLRDIEGGRDKQIAAAVQAIDAVHPDVLLLTGFDWDYQGVALAAFAARLGPDYPHRYAPRPNTGMATGLDLDGNGRMGQARDAQGYGRFAGEGGMALLSRLPLGEARDFSAFLWADLPGAQVAGQPPEVLKIQRLSTTAHWDVPVLTASGPLHLLAHAATPPAFEPRNIARNHDETAFWLRYLDGALPVKPAPGPFVVLGQMNLDPDKGAGDRAALTTLLSRVRDPLPGRDTVDYGKPPGALRTDYVLPSPDLTVTGAGIGPLGGSRHHIVWVDISLP
ncbi:endonuclease/exonuclease/phosphatase family protein [Paenirhodobacter sp.]|uniref:endonuclease/exonuclease/phosphatase family protein n=1 Tax=Paenirhodobacter sp. TaxID=1965326 RepID=UPI003B3D7229